jgi:hypothetical protein
MLFFMWIAAGLFGISIYGLVRDYSPDPMVRLKYVTISLSLGPLSIFYNIGKVFYVNKSSKL